MVYQKSENDKSVYSVSLDQSVDKRAREKWWKIDKDMIRIKLHFFLLAGAAGSTAPFLAIIAKNRLGLSATSLAMALVFSHFLSVLIKPVIGFITDYFNKLKLILYVLVTFQGIFLYLFLILPLIPREVKINQYKTFVNCSDSEVDCDNKTFIDFLNCCEFMSDPSDCINTSQMTLNDSEDPNLDSSSILKYKTDLIPIDNSSNELHSDETVFRDILTNSSLRTYHPGFSKELEKNTTSLFNQSLMHSLPCSDISNKSLISLCNSINCCCYEEYNNSFSDLFVESNAQELSSASRKDFLTYQFWAFLVVFSIFNTCRMTIITLSDTACCECVQKKGAEFGKQRLYGAVGWGLFAPIAGYLSDFTSDYLTAWIIFTVLSLVMLWNISQMDLVKPQSSKSLYKDIRTIIKSKNFLFFEVGVLTTGIGIGFLYSYLGWFVVSIGGNRLLCGLVETIQCFVGEIPMMFFSGWILKKIGCFNVTTMALLSHCIRFLWYSQLQNPWMILLVEWTHGVSYGLFYTSMASYAKKSATPGTEATIQSVVFAIYGLGRGMGNILAGIGFDYIGTKQTFLYAGVFFVCCSSLSILISLVTCSREKSENLK
ncbi:major facilitator superfamily domain-containing protein 6 [Nephila pilipes]|uniref:Major facilitator superfamily domain-containing protein 6 n=1 Tax=Nephila pilipes TaxID=299642 RepID=A0A8X6Q900_NEPPI|nr:major facilitator superfamily domain-containing protein 6 [Nephila pilipes]